MKSTNKSEKLIKMVNSWLLVICWACVIFYLSSRTADESTVQSRGMINSVSSIFGTVIDSNKLVWIDGIVRESAHAAEYFILGVLLYNALIICLNYRKQEEMMLTAQTGVMVTDRFRELNCFICSLLICSIYALSDEIHQIPVPGRTFQMIDLILDVSGAAFGTLFMLIIYKVMEKKRRHK